MYILGISAFYHDSAAVLLKDGKIIAAVEEERFTRVKHDNAFPEKAISFCLNYAKINAQELDAIAYYEKPLLKFERILDTFISTYPRSLKPFLKTIPEWLGQKINVEQKIRKTTKFKGKIYFIPHHLSHAAASFYASEFNEAAIATIDGVGEYQTTALWHGKGNEIKPLQEINFPSSAGLLYSTFTAFLGFRVNNDEYKMMGLAAYGKAKYASKIRELIDVKADGSFNLDMQYFSFREAFQMWNKKFEELFGRPRKPQDSFIQHHKDLAASIQLVTEEIYFKILNHLYSITESSNLCIAGGVGLNSLANGKIYSKTPFKRVSILGPAGDSGGAIGAALYTYHSILKHNGRKPVTNLYLGSVYSHPERTERVEGSHTTQGLTWKKFVNEKRLVETVATLLSKNKVIGWFQGRMEFGPRALGARSILANPQPKWMKDRVNEIKGREEFRPFAGSVLQEHVYGLFEVPEKNHYSPFMNFCFPVRKAWRKKLGAITHADNTCRIQTVNEKDNGRYYRLITEFNKLTGVPCLLNTSFNLSHEPIVETPEQTIEDLTNTNLDYLVIENTLVTRNNVVLK